MIRNLYYLVDNLDNLFVATCDPGGMRMRTALNGCIHAHTHTRTHAHTHTPTHTHAHTRARAHAHARTRAHAHTHTHTHPSRPTNLAPQAQSLCPSLLSHHMATRSVNALLIVAYPSYISILFIFAILTRFRHFVFLHTVSVMRCDFKLHILHRIPDPHIFHSK